MTIAEAIRNESLYPISESVIELKLMKRDLQGAAEATMDILGSREYKGALADTLATLIISPNVSEESGVSISLPERNLLLKYINSLYTAIGEEAVGVPRVEIL